MAEKCAVCGKGIGGIIGKDDASSSQKSLMEKLGIWDEGKPICTVCAQNKIQDARQEARQMLAEAQAYITDAPFNNIQAFTARHPEDWQAEIRGMVSGYSVVGTGPLTAIASAWTDFLGEESSAYLKKIRIGEKNAILAAKMQAIELGATDICDATLAISEATSGHGMLMVSFVGTAIYVEEHKYEEGTPYVEAQERIRVANEKLHIIHELIKSQEQNQL